MAPIPPLMELPALLNASDRPRQDMHALWRRMVFNVLVSNTDDHLRNHAFLHVPGCGWALSPAYDLNPVPPDVAPRILRTASSEDDGAAPDGHPGDDSADSGRAAGGERLSTPLPRHPP